MTKQEDCIFCKIISGEIKSDIVYNDDKFIAILDLHPKAVGHTLVIPKDHFRNLLDMPETLGPELLTSIKEVSLKLIKEGKGEGVNVIVNNEPSAGQVVMHSHIHIIPRKNNDGLKSIV